MLLEILGPEQKTSLHEFIICFKTIYSEAMEQKQIKMSL